LKNLKIPPKIYLNGLIQYVEKDVEKNSIEFETLIDNCDFKKLKPEYVKKLFKKKIFLQNSIKFLKKAFESIDKGSDDEKSNSGSDSEKSNSDSNSDSEKSNSDSDSNSEKSSEESEEEEEGNGVPKFQKKFYSKLSLTLSKNMKKIVYNLTSVWQGSALGTSCSRYTVKLMNCNYLMIGFAPKTISLAGDNNEKCGFYLYLNKCSKYSQDGDRDVSYSSADYTDGVVYGAEYNKNVILIFNIIEKNYYLL
jgi:hypothetical protein